MGRESNNVIRGLLKRAGVIGALKADWHDPLKPLKRAVAVTALLGAGAAYGIHQATKPGPQVQQGPKRSLYD